MTIRFSEENIQGIFGHEAAEDEKPERLKQYYFKTKVYERIINDLALRILVGHKGIGKSALFKVALHEHAEVHELAILVQPNDVAGLGTESTGFSQLIHSWAQGLRDIIVAKVFYLLGIDSSYHKHLETYQGSIFNFVEDAIKQAKTITRDDSELLKKTFQQDPKIFIYIDDLDRGWQGKKEDITRISALLNAVRDLSNENRGLKFRIALRSDVYFLVRTSDESTDKLEGSVVWHSWTNHEIFVLLIKRIETYLGRTVDEQELLNLNQSFLADTYLNDIMEPRFTGYGKWENAPMYRILMSLIRRRPRDLVKLCTLATRQAYLQNSDLIHTSHLQAIFEEYSQGRIQDTINEFRSELPNVKELIFNMKPNKRERTTKEGFVYTTDALIKKINQISQSHRFEFAGNRQTTSKDLAAFLYKINFLTARKEIPNGIERKYFEENRYLSSSSTDFGFAWEVHPAYRWALQPNDLNSIYYDLDLSAEDNN